MNMAHIKDAEILIAAIFGISGFIMAYYLRRGVNFILFGIFLYASFRGLETLNYHPDWNNFDKFVSILQQLGKTILLMINNMISTAGTISIMLFLFGGVMGLVLSRRGA
jgi:hypothetical protein